MTTRGAVEPTELTGEVDRDQAADAAEAEHEGHERPTLDDVGEEREIAGVQLGTRRRRPSGEPPPLPSSLRTSGRLWLGLFVLAVVLWVVTYAVRSSQPPLERTDDAVLDALASLRTPWLTWGARASALLGSVWCVLILRWLTIATLVVFRRWRHLITFVVSVAALRVLVGVLVDVFGRPRPPGIRILGSWDGYSHPSRQVAVLAVTLVGMAFALVPVGRWRKLAFRIAGVLLGLLVAARLYLAVEHPSDAAVGLILGVAFAVVAFRLYCPDRVFPVTYRKRESAQLPLEGDRTRAIKAAVGEQLGLDVSNVEPMESDSSGGSTPVRITVRHGEGTIGLFGKLYAEVHLRSDRRYKLGRAILYGSLEDEAAFNSVRQLVEHEDYMLRLTHATGLPTPAPHGFVEITPEREYLLVTDLFERSAEADDDGATIDEPVIDSGLRIVQRMWAEGIAHRDIKPANVLIQDGHVRLIDLAFAQARPSPWRQAVDLANMMLVMALGSDAKRVYDRATRIFDPEEIGEAFAATRSITIPHQLRTALKEDGRDLIGEFRRLAPARDPIAIQRWSIRRIALTVRTTAVVLVVGLGAVALLANPGAP